MIEKPSDDLPRASHSHLSHSAIGRLTNSAARFIANVSKFRATGRYLRRQLWAWPLVAVVLFGGAGWWVHLSVEDAMRVQRVNELNVRVDASVSAVRLWMREQTITAQLFADDEQLRALALELLALEDDTQESDRQLLLAPAQGALRNRLNSRLISCGFIGFFVVSPNGIILSADQDPPIGKKLTGYRKEFFDGVNEGVPAVSRPFRSPLLLLDEDGNERAELPTMFAAAPIKDERGNTIATLGLRARPQDQFTRILVVVPGFLAAVLLSLYAAGVTPVIDSTITLGNIVQSFCTVFAAFYVARVINLWSSNRQKEKELLYARFSDFLQQLQQIDELSDQTPYERVPPILKKLALRCVALIECGRASSILNVDEASKEMEQRVKREQ